MTRAAGTSRITHLERRRREMAAAYVKAARRHAPRAALADKLVRATCDALRAEIKAQQAAVRDPAASGLPDLFGDAPEPAPSPSIARRAQPFSRAGLAGGGAAEWPGKSTP